MAALRPIAAGVLPRTAAVRRRHPTSDGSAAAAGDAASSEAATDSAAGAGAGAASAGAGAAATSDALAASGLTFSVKCLYIIQRDGFADPFRVVGRVALGDGPIGEDCLPIGFVYSPPEPPEGSRCLGKGGNGTAILKARTR